MLKSEFMLTSLPVTLESLPALSPLPGLLNYFIKGSKGAQEIQQKMYIA